MSLLTLLLIVDFKIQMTHLLLYVDGPTVHKKISIMHVPTVSLASSFDHLPLPFYSLSFLGPIMKLALVLCAGPGGQSDESINVSRILWRKARSFSFFSHN